MGIMCAQLLFTTVLCVLPAHYLHNSRENMLGRAKQDQNFFLGKPSMFKRKKRKYIGLLPILGGEYPPTNIFSFFS